MNAKTYRKSTIQDVARHAGVSSTTVSHFVSGRERTCSAATAERLRDAIAALKYSPNSQGRALRLGKTNTIGISTEAVFEVEKIDFYVTRLWRGVSRQAGKHDYSLLYYPPSVREGTAAGPFLDGRVDGIIFSSDHNDDRPEAIASAGFPIVMLTRYLDVPLNCGTVYADECDTVALALTHLWDLGHRRIAHVAGPIIANPGKAREHNAQCDTAIERHAQYVHWMTVRSAYDPGLVAIENAWEPQNPQAIVERWQRLDQPPTAVFCANDRLAYGIIEAATQAGLTVPGNLSVVGVDNSDMVARTEQPLTTVEIPVEEIGSRSVEAVLNLIAGASVEECRLAIPVTTLVKRSSTAPLSVSLPRNRQ